MFAFIGSLVSSAISGVFSPIMAYLNKKQDVGLAEYQQMTSVERDEYAAYVKGLNDTNTIKAQANNWWGGHLMVYMFGIPAALHWNAVFWVNTFPHAWSWFGLTVVPAVPANYANAELTIALSFFIYAALPPVVSTVADMVKRKS